MRRRSNTPHVLVGSLLALASFSSGCAVLQSIGLVPNADRAEVTQVGALPHATCEEHWRAYPEPPLADPTATSEAKVMDALCWPQGGYDGDPRTGAREALATRGALAAGKRPYVQAHFAHDDRRVDPLQASLMVSGCVDHGTCEEKRRYVVGQMAVYADQASPREVEQALGGLDLSPEVRQAYLDHYTDARQHVLGLLEQMPEKDAEVCRDIPREVRERRADYYEDFADHYERFDALWPRLAGVMDGESGDADLLAQTVKLRDEHVAACFERSTLEPLQCWHATPARPLTEAIMRMAARQGDAPRAWVEQETLKSGRDQFSMGNEISYTQTAAMRSSSRAYTAWDPMNVVAHDADLEASIRTMAKDIEWVTAKVDSVSISGDQATVSLQTKVEKRTDQICKETNKIDRVKDGKVYYKKKCRDGKTHVTRTPYAPVTVPAADVANLSKDLRVRVAVEPESRKGHLLEVTREKPSLGKYRRLHFRSTPLSRD